MPRLDGIEISDWEPELRSMVDVEKTSPLLLRSIGIMAQAPHMARADFAFLRTAMPDLRLSPTLLELVRLRIGFHNQCRSCMAMRFQSALDDGLTEDMVCSLEKPMEAPNLSAADKAALEYVDLFATNHFAIGDEVMSGLRQHFTDGEIVELGMFAGFFLGMGRFLASLDIVEELPKEFRDKSVGAAPWLVDQTIVVG